MRTIKQEHYFPVIIGIHFILWAIALYLYQGDHKEVHSDTLFYGELNDVSWNNIHRILGEVFSSWVVTVFAANFLMATRARWVERMFGGLDKMYMIHRRSGIIAVVLLLLHFVFVPRDLTEFTPGKPMGFYALVLILIGVMISYAPFFKRKLKYHKWLNFHKLMGLFYILGIVHSVKVPTLTSELPLVWGYVYGMALIGIAAWFYKAFLYNLFNKKLKYSVASVKQFGNDMLEISLKPEDKKLTFGAGQFAFVSFKGINKQEQHPYTISSHPSDENLRITVKALGDYTADLQTSLEKGVEAKVQGPFGQFDFKNAKYKKQLWLAGGIGITPYLSFIREVGDDYDVKMVWSVNKLKDANYKNEIEAVTNNKPNLDFIMNDSETQGHFTIDKLYQSIDLKDHSVFICGPEVMRESYIKQLMQKGVSIRDIHYEEFSFR